MNTFKQIEICDRPEEKFLKLGPEELSDRELIAILLRTGTKNSSVIEIADSILSINSQYDGLVGLMHFGLDEFMTVDGIGRTKAVQLAAVGEISSRIWKRNMRVNSTSYNNSNSIVNFYKEELRYLDHEELRIMFLDSHLHLLKEMCVSTGTTVKSIMSPPKILKEALKAGALCMIMVHNHPSGDSTPSMADIQSTRDLREASSLVGIDLLDHVIIGDNQYYSFKEQGIL